MRYQVLAFGALAVAAACGPVVGTASAQVTSPVGPVTQPSFSPYLNLLRRDSPTYLNYYGLVRPQQDFRRSVQTLRQDVNNVSQAQQQAADPNADPSFEAASIKPTQSSDGGSFVRRQPGGRFDAHNVAARFLMTFAYQLQPFQLVGDPDYLRSNFIGGIKHMPVEFTPGKRES